MNIHPFPVIALCVAVIYVFGFWTGYQCRKMKEDQKS